MKDVDLEKSGFLIDNEFISSATIDDIISFKVAHDCDSARVIINKDTES